MVRALQLRAPATSPPARREVQVSAWRLELALQARPRGRRMVKAAIEKKRRTSRPSLVDHKLVGRRVQVPQEVFGLSDEDGSAFFFAGTIKAAAPRRLLIRFDYTGEEEWHQSTLVARWLEEDLGPLIQRLSSSCTAGDQSTKP